MTPPLFAILLALLAAGPTPSPAASAAKTAPVKPGARTIPDRSAFAGSKRCADCHAENHARWLQDWHARALAPATPASVAGDWNDFHFKGSSSEAWMKHEGLRHLVRTLDLDGALRDYEVSWVVGGRRMQDPVTVFPDGRWQVLPVYYHVTGREWVDYTESKQGPIGPSHPFFWANFRRTANRECLDCHLTGMKVGYDRTTRRWSTAFTDAGVACESCHGPGARHTATADPADIVHPGKLAPALALAVCAPCHGPREPYFPLLDAALRFRPGQTYESRYEAVQVIQAGKLSPDFFADGRPRSSSYEYPALLQSACYRRGGATCLSCHTPPHGDHLESEIKKTSSQVVSAADASCAGCHRSELEAGTEHSHHRSARAQSCVACHMPKVVAGVLDRFADHTIDVPVPENTVRHGVPSACGECHPREGAGELSRALLKWWPGAAARQARRLRLADAIDPATDANSFAPLGGVLRDESEAPTVRAAAATLLGGRFPRQAAQVLADALGASAAEVRVAAARALGEAEAGDALPERARVLRPLLSDRDVRVRVAAASVLTGLDDFAGIDALDKIARDPATARMWRPQLELGLSLARRGRFADAERKLERARELQFYSINVLLGLADLKRVAGRKEEARAVLEEALRYDPENPAVAERLKALGSAAK